MTRLNRITSANCPSNRFITFFFCILDGDTGELTFCNAGHNPPLIIRADGTYVQLQGGGPVLGILPFIEYEEYHEQLAEGDVLVIYSDGVTEANNPAGDEFEIEGLSEAVIQDRHLPASAIVTRINQALTTYTAGAPPSDDITVIVARRVA
jgi:serine phosphatase RsbU (regulator of sigma subunit)